MGFLGKGDSLHNLPGACLVHPTGVNSLGRMVALRTLRMLLVGRRWGVSWVRGRVEKIEM